MARKIFIHTKATNPNEDFVDDIQIPLNAKKVTGVLVNAYDRRTGLIVKSEREKVYFSPVNASDFISENQQLINYYALPVVTKASNATSDEILASRDEFVLNLIDSYNSEILKKSDPIFNDVFLAGKKNDFDLTLLRPSKDPIFYAGKSESLYEAAEGFRSEIGLKTIELLNDFIVDTTDRQAALHQLAPSSSLFTYAPADLIAWYRRFESEMIVKDGATTPNYGNTFFNDPANFAIETFRLSTVFVKKPLGTNNDEWLKDGETEVATDQLVNAFSYFAEKFGYPHSSLYNYPVNVVSGTSYYFNPFKTASIALNAYSNMLAQHIWNKNFVFNWDKSTVGEISILFNSGRDVAIRDMPVELNNNTINIHKNILNVTQKEQVNSFVRMVYKDYGKSTNSFFVKTYFFYET